MATAVWPATLPQNPLISGWQWTPQKNKVSFKPAVGPAIERRRGTAVVYNYTTRFPPLTDAQLVTFETWFHDTLASGTLHFLWLDPVSGTNYKWKIEAYQINSIAPSLHGLFLNLKRLPGAAV
jgi:hypothetical protein